MSCSRVAMKATALAFPLTAASMTGGALEYSANRSFQVLSTSECTSTILPEISPALAKSAELPFRTSITGTCVAAASAGAHAMETQRTRNSTLGICVSLGSSAVPVALTVISVAPSAQEDGIVNSSVCTLSAPAALNICAPHSMARCIAGVPGTRPPTSSVRWRRLLSSVEGCSAIWMMREAASVSVAGLAATQRADRVMHRQRTFLCRICGELEINFWKRAKSGSGACGRKQIPPLRRYRSSRNDKSPLLLRQRIYLVENRNRLQHG